MDVWRVFVSDAVLVKDSGILLGQVILDKKAVVVKDVTFTPATELPQDIAVGCWAKIGLENDCNNDIIQNNNLHVSLTEISCGNLKCSLYNHAESEEALPCVCIVFNTEILRQSQLIGLTDEFTPTTTLYKVKEYVTQNNKEHVQDHAKTTSRSGSLFIGLLNAMLILENMFIRCFEKIPGISKVLLVPSVTQQIHRKWIQITHIKDRSPKDYFVSRNTCARQVIDSCLGIILLWTILKLDYTSYIADGTLQWADNIADKLTNLLQWLMGNPGGLKLNRQLTNCLGHIFQYHVYLWKGYLFLMQPILASLLWYCSLVGVMGVTFQVCLLQDILSVMTLHVYCFYVYGARLYRLQVYTLSALWRLFRGRKWNILRNRVDSASFDIDQLFVGTLIFTVLLFLLPTTLLYYTVFTLLRLAVLIVQGALSMVVDILNSFPVHSLALWVIKSNTVKCDMVVKTVPSDVNSHTSSHYAMDMALPSLSKLMSLCREERATIQVTWSDLTSNLIKGHLVYPWMTNAT